MRDIDEDWKNPGNHDEGIIDEEIFNAGDDCAVTEHVNRAIDNRNK